MAVTDTTFASNPLIRAIGDQLGLDPLFNAATQTKPVNAVTAPPVRPAASRPNMAESRDLPSAQLRLMRMMQMSQGSRTQANGIGMMPGGPGETPMMSEDTLKDPSVQAMLKSYGVNPDVQVDPHLFIHNPAAWEKHPVLSGLLEGGLSGLAFTNGSNTIGEGLSNVARGMMANQSAHAERVNAQLMMPFQQASTVAQLRALQQGEQLRDAQIKEAGARENYYNSFANYRDTVPQDPIKILQQQIVDHARSAWAAAHNGQEMPVEEEQKLLGSFEGMIHPQRAVNVKPLDAIFGKYSDAIKAQLVKQYGTLDDVPPEAWLQAGQTLDDMIQKDKKDGKFPPTGRGGRTPEENDQYRQSIIDKGNDLIQMVVGQLRPAGKDYMYSGAPIPGLKAQNGRVTAQALADFKNKVASDINVQLTRAKLAPIIARYTAEGTAPGASPAPSAAPAGVVASPVNGWQGQMPVPIAPARPAADNGFSAFYQKYLADRHLPDKPENMMKARAAWNAQRQQPGGAVPPVGMLKQGFATPLKNPVTGQLEKWTLNAQGQPVKVGE